MRGWVVMILLLLAACSGSPVAPVENRVVAVASTPPPPVGNAPLTPFIRAPLAATSVIVDDGPIELPAAPPLETPREAALGLAVTTTIVQIRADRPLRTEIFRPDGPGPHPGLLLLHGASGVGDGEAAYLRASAEYFSTQGFVVFLPHYLDQPAPRGRTPARRQSGNTVAQYEKLATRIDAVFEEMNRSAWLDRDRITVFGFSLGAFHGLALAARDTRVRAVVSLGGGIPGNVTPSVRRMPPTLVIHGGRDNIVPVARGRQVQKIVQDRGGDAQIVVYADQGHFLRGTAGPDALIRTTRFLKSSLNLPVVVAGPSAVRTVRVAPPVEVPPPAPPRPAPRR